MASPRLLNSNTYDGGVGEKQQRYGFTVYGFIANGTEAKRKANRRPRVGLYDGAVDTTGVQPCGESAGDRRGFPLSALATRGRESLIYE